MNDKNTFKEADAEKIVEFLNFIAKEAKFDNMDVQKTIKFYGLLSWAQQGLVSKIKDNILEVVKVHTPEPKAKPKAKAKAE